MEQTTGMTRRDFLKVFAGGTAGAIATAFSAPVDLVEGVSSIANTWANIERADGITLDDLLSLSPYMVMVQNTTGMGTAYFSISELGQWPYGISLNSIQHVLNLNPDDKFKRIHIIDSKNPSSKIALDYPNLNNNCPDVLVTDVGCSFNKAKSQRVWEDILARGTTDNGKPFLGHQMPIYLRLVPNNKDIMDSNGISFNHNEYCQVGQVVMSFDMVPERGFIPNIHRIVALEPESGRVKLEALRLNLHDLQNQINSFICKGMSGGPIIPVNGIFLQDGSFRITDIPTFNNNGFKCPISIGEVMSFLIAEAVVIERRDSECSKLTAYASINTNASSDEG